MLADIELNPEIPMAVTGDVTLVRRKLPDTGPLVTDCVFLKWNDAALDLLGVESLAGRYWSEFRSHEATTQCQRRHVAVLKKPSSHINDESWQCFERGGIGGELVWCKKSVETRRDERGTVWVTTYHVSSQPGHLTTYTLEELGLMSEDVRDVCGDHTVASMQGLTSVTPLSTILPQNLQSSKHADCNGVELSWHEPKGHRRGKLLCACVWCSNLWFATSGTVPRQCANRLSCGREDWSGAGEGGLSLL